MVCLTFGVSVSLVPFQIFFEKVMVLLFHHQHDSILAASRCTCWKPALGLVWPVAWGCEMAWCVFTWLSELCVTQSVVEPKLQCPLERKLLCRRTLKTSIWSACPKFNLGKSTRRPHLWMSTSYHCFSAEGEGRCSAFLLETCYYSLVKVFSILDIVFWRVVSGFGDEIRMALLCCLFPVAFEVCRHQFQAETRGLFFTGDVWQNSCSLDGVSGKSLIVNSHFLKPGVRSTWLYLTENQPKYSVTTSYEHSSLEHVFTRASLGLYPVVLGNKSHFPVDLNCSMQ